MQEVEFLMNEGEEIIGFEQEELDALFASFDYNETGDLEDYENPDDDVKEEYLKCPNCNETALKEEFKKVT